MYNMMLEIIGYWVKEKELIISVLEVIEIIRGLVPWHSVQNYKIMRQLPILVHNRLTNVKMNTPLTVGIFEKIVNVVLEVSIALT